MTAVMRGLVDCLSDPEERSDNLIYCYTIYIEKVLFRARRHNYSTVVFQK